jgi:sigma-B regulation protein RsbU (phosphoserine phosphatase)
MPEKVLIVDDSVDNRRLLVRTLQKSGFELAEAANGKEALSRTREFYPDLILLDIMMPELDGYQVCETLKSDPDTADIPVIFLSAKTETQDKIKGLEIGGVDYITKPFDRGEVLARVRTQLKLRSLMKEILEKQKRLDEDLRAAAAIQASLLPQQLPELDGFACAWKFVPCDLMGGDIFNILPLDEEHLAIYMVDVSGHGVPAAMVTVSVSQMLQAHGGCLKRKIDVPPYYKIASPQKVLQALDREYPLERFNKYFTIVYLIVDVVRGRVVYSNAGHPAPLLLHGDGRLDSLDKGGTIIGLNGLVPFEQEQNFVIYRRFAGI